MIKQLGFMAGAAALVATGAMAEPAKVNTDNFTRAESDLFFSNLVATGSFGKMHHTREMVAIDAQAVVRLNRDTLYSSGIFDLDAGPVTITIPDSGKRFISMQLINQDQYSMGVHYQPGDYRLTREAIGTRYVLVAMRVLANPDDPADMQAVHQVQDGIVAKQAKSGVFELPEWDEKSRNGTRAALAALSKFLPDSKRMFGSREEVDPVRHLVGTAVGWGGNPEKDALYLGRSEPKNDSKTAYRLKVGEVPVDGFWSISVYNAKGYFEKNARDAYTVNNITGVKDKDGSMTIQFGDCRAGVVNCLDISEGWNYTVRLYRPSAEVLSGAWQFPAAVTLD